MKLLLSFFLLLFSSFSFAQYWARNTESAFVNEAMDVEVDDAGNSYICGYITGETAFDITVSEPTALGNGDIYVAKYSANGSLIWIKKYGGNNSDRAYDLAIDGNQNILVTGQFFGTVNFDGISITSSGNSKDIFLIKMNSLGTVLWARSEGGANVENAYGVTTDQLNNVILTGQFTGNSTIAGLTFNSFIDPLLNVAAADIFISKYDSNGNPLWAKTGQADYEDRGLAVHTDSQNNIFMTGQFSDTLFFDGQQVNNNGYNVGLLAKISPAGNLLWLNTLRAGMVLPYDLEVNNVDEVVLTGDFLGNLLYSNAGSSSTITNPYTKQIFAMKVSSNGSYLWGTSLGSENALSASSVSIDNAKDIYITGFFSCDFTEMQTNQAIFNSVGFKDIYLWKVSNIGSTTFVKQFGGKKDDEGHGVAIQNSIKPIICGGYTNDLNFPEGIVGYSIAMNHFNLIDESFNEVAHNYLWGDESRNSFLTNAIGNFTPIYNYFYLQPSDSLIGFIEPDLDTIHLCWVDSIPYDPQTYVHYGPGYNYQWNPGTPTQYNTILNSGSYTVNVERWDQCSSGGDTVYVIIHSSPTLPVLNDQFGDVYTTTSNGLYHYYHLCYPDTITSWFTNICQNCSIEIHGSSMNFYDSLAHDYTIEDSYEVIIQDSFCTNTAYFIIDLDYVSSVNIDPYMILWNDIDDNNDSIKLCENEQFNMHIYDYFENSDTTLFLFPSDFVAENTWDIQTPYGTFSTAIDTFRLNFDPWQSGWYTVTYTGAFGYNNLCGIDTTVYVLSKTFYVEILPNPVGSTLISGDSFICPDGSVYLTLSNVLYDLTWWGPAINWTSSAADSVQVTASGEYHYGGNLIDTITGCSTFMDFIYTLNEKQEPQIIGDPADGIICPYDSVYMYINNSYQSYNWVGPSGDSLSLTSDLYDVDQGYYYCTVVDSDGCSLTSPPFEIKEYTTPFLMVEPDNVLCSGEQATITAIIDGDGVATWASPLSGTNETVTVNQAGWYYCSIQQCGIETIDSVLIIDGTFSAALNLSDSVICFGEVASISAPSGMSNYEWSTGEMGMQSIMVGDEGFYSALITNNWGCQDYTDTVFIDFIENSQAPQIADVSLCNGEDILIENPLGLNNSWYSSDTTLIQISAGIYLPNVVENTILFAAYNNPQCPLILDEVYVSVVQPLPVFSIVGDQFLCPVDTSIYSINVTSENVQWVLNGVQISTVDSLELTSLDFQNDQSLDAIVTNSCYSATYSISITILPTQPLTLLEDTLILCPYDSLTITPIEQYPTVIWASSFGIYENPEIVITGGIGSGFVNVSAIDVNACPTGTDSVFILASMPDYIIEYFPVSQCDSQEVTLGVETNAISINWMTPNGIDSTSSLSFILGDQNDGMYVLNLIDSLGCSYSDSIEIISYPYPTFTYSSDTSICIRDYMITPYLGNNLDFVWDNIGQVDSVMFPIAAYYSFTVTTPNGCKLQDSIYIELIDCTNELPNVITANNDGVNDLFVIDEANLFPENKLIIINRWGNVVFEDDGYLNTWGADNIIDGVYFYEFYYDYKSDPDWKVTGFITIIK